MDAGCSGCGGGSEPHRALVIRTPADALRLLKWTQRYDAIVVALPMLNEAVAQAAQSQLDRYYFECGCTAGARAMLAALAVGPAAAWLSWPYTFTDTLSAFSIWFGVVIVSTLTAKMVVLLNAQILLRRAIKELVGVLN